MKLVKSLLLGSAAGFAALTGAQAADLPVRKAAPVEYVRVCTAYGAGYFYIPGTDTCIRIGGRARYEYQFSETLSRGAGNGAVSGYRTLGRLNLDARTQTAYGTLRTFVRFDLASRSGAYLTSGSQQRLANAFPALGPDTFGQLQKFVDVDKAFVQFAGLTAGRAQSFFDFYAHDLEIIGSSVGSDANQNLLAYTATFGEGFSATISMEDPVYRRQPIYGGGGSATAQTAFNIFTNAAQFAPTIVATDAFGNPTVVGLTDVLQKSRLPDFVGNLRYDAPWGSAQLSAAVHEINAGQTSSLAAINGGLTPIAGAVSRGRVNSEYGFAVQGGLKINTPFVAPGDLLWLQGAYAQGGNTYSGVTSPPAYDLGSTPLVNGAFAFSQNDAVVNPFTGRLDLTESFSVVASYLHYWAPEFRSAFFGTYGEMHFSKQAAFGNALIGFGFQGLVQPTAAAAATAANAFQYNSTLRDVGILFVGANLIWSPVRDLDIGVEGVYQRANILNGRVTDTNKVTAVTNGIPNATTRSQDNALIRFRVQRDF